MKKKEKRTREREEEEEEEEKNDQVLQNLYLDLLITFVLVFGENKVIQFRDF
jgi:hypothetical protein